MKHRQQMIHSKMPHKRRKICQLIACKNHYGLKPQTFSDKQKWCAMLHIFYIDVDLLTNQQFSHMRYLSRLITTKMSPAQYVSDQKKRNSL